MARFINSQSLELVNRALLLDGGGAPATELTDGTVEQVLDIVPIARRGGCLAGGTEGLFRGLLRNTHGAASVITSGINLFTIGVTGGIAPFPTPIPNKYDLWILGASATRFSGSGAVAGQLMLTNLVQGWGVDNGGAAVAANIPLQLARWDAVVDMTTGTDPLILTATGTSWQPLRFRVPRIGSFSAPVSLQWQTESSAAAVYDCTIWCGLFPLTLGQDGIA